MRREGINTVNSHPSCVSVSGTLVREFLPPQPQFKSLLWFEYLIPGAQICLLHSHHESMEVVRKKPMIFFFFFLTRNSGVFFGFWLYHAVPTRDWTCVPCTARQALNHWTAKEVPEVWVKYWGKIICPFFSLTWAGGGGGLGPGKTEKQISR